MPGALPPTPTGLGSLSLAFAALRLRQSSIGLCGHQAKAAGLCPALHALHTPGCLQRWSWTPGLEAGAQLLGLLGQLGFFCFVFVLLLLG